jgi:PAS domain S-box-containing protein
VLGSETPALNRFARFALAQLSDATYWMEEDASIIYVNQAACDLMAYSAEELLAMKVYELNTELDAGRWPAIWALLKAEGKRVFEAQHRRKDGKVLPVEITANFLLLDGKEYSCAFVRDISARKELEHRLMQVAHDFNNQLAGIMGCTDLLRHEVEGSAAATELVDELTGAVLRASEVTSQLLAFSRRGKFMTEPVDLNHLVDEVVKILSHSIDKQIRVDTELDESAWTLGDPSQLQNAILNMALNARDAMPDGGTITLRTERVELDEFEVSALHANVAAGDYVALSVRDSGVGMDAETQQRLFEPFFTKKETGAGTGLGMAAVYGTIKHHHGAITVDSEIGRGSLLTVYLPVSRPGAPIRPDVGEVSTMTLQGHVLIVEDEPALLRLTGRMLESLGCEISAFLDGKAALEHYRDYRDAIDLVLLDMVLPGASGSEIFAALRESDPKVRVLFMSGYSQDGQVQALIDAGGCGFLEKPFTLAELAGEVGRVLTGRQPR